MTSPVGSYRTSGTSTSTSDGDAIVGFIGLAATGVTVWALVCAARITMVAVSLLFQVFSSTPPDGFVVNVFLSALGGIFAGITTAVVRAWPRKPGQVEKSFISALFSKNLAAPKLDGTFFGRVLISGAIGLLVGAITGASGMISFPQFFSDSTAQVFHDTAYPLMAFAAGGFGGPGGDGVLSIIFMILVIVILSICAGCIIGFVLQLVIAALFGGIKGTTKSAVTKMLEEKDPQGSSTESHPIRAGAIKGALTGLLAGVVQASFTAWGIVHFAH